MNLVLLAEKAPAAARCLGMRVRFLASGNIAENDIHANGVLDDPMGAGLLYEHGAED